MVIHLMYTFTVRYTLIKSDWLYEQYSKGSIEKKCTLLHKQLYDITLSIFVVYRQYGIIMTKHYAHAWVYQYR